MNNPKLITAPNESEQCCLLNDKGERCPQRSRFWVGANGVDDYTYVCGDHVNDVKRDGDVVQKIG